MGKKLRTFRVYDADFNLLAEGEARHCAETLGMNTRQIYRGSERYERCGALFLGYYIESAGGPSEETEIDSTMQEAIKQWDDFVEPIRRKYGIKVYKPGKTAGGNT